MYNGFWDGFWAVCSFMNILFIFFKAGPEKDDSRLCFGALGSRGCLVVAQHATHADKIV